ncbi:hypothetical protein ACHAXA_008026 [Cyclostephanos tholiformis]|uniref:ABC transporter domain-containing protein n=1 Tax=Cyclostephanos tholiformis TaxID=382380 RepID=A0ABD3RFA5_9STRA
MMTTRRGGGGEGDDDSRRAVAAASSHDGHRRPSLGPFHLCVWPNLETPPSSSSSSSYPAGGGGGGHVALGRNGSGKTLLSLTLASTAASTTIPVVARGEEGDDTSFLHSGELTMRRGDTTGGTTRRDHRFLSTVSFESHSDLLLNESTTTVYRALIPGGGNRLSDTAKFLSVRLGMFPLLNRYVNTLSTGQIRRVLLVRALVSRPSLLVLDNAYDGLDVEGRSGLRDIIERVLRGFRMDILVQGVGDARDAARTQVLLLTHRPEEISDGFGRVTFLDGIGEGGGGGGVRTEDRSGRTGEELVRSLVSNGTFEGEEGSDADAASDHPWDIVPVGYVFPSEVDVKNFWEPVGESMYETTDPQATVGESDILVHSRGLKVTRDNVTLISRLDWTVKRGERWHLAGTNGAGKSTLSRLLLRRSLKYGVGCDFAINGSDAMVSEGSLVVTPSMTSRTRLARGGLGWVSTELHLHAAHNWGRRTVGDILLSGASFMFNSDKNNQNNSSAADGASSVEFDSSDLDVAMTAACWLGLLENGHVDDFFRRPFSTLSQGEQKLLLLSSAIAQRPKVLVLDEPCQGLDLWNRGRLLGLVERICRVTDMSLLYVTHHEEELIPSIGHRLCLEDGDVSYCGSR